MQIVENYLTNNPCYQQNKKMTAVKGLMLHSVGCAQAKASYFLNTFNRATAQAMVHGFIDANDGIIYQTAPWDMRCWHSASGKNGRAYDTYIGVEMCEPSYPNIQYEFGKGTWFTINDYDAAKKQVDTAYNSAVELFAWLCIKFDLDPKADGVIICHAEGYKRGIASNHADVGHLLPRFEHSMDGFRADVVKRCNEMIKEAIAALSNEDCYNIMKKANTYAGTLEPEADWAKKAVANAQDLGISDGTRPRAFATRQEVMGMCKNVKG